MYESLLPYLWTEESKTLSLVIQPEEKKNLRLYEKYFGSEWATISVRTDISEKVKDVKYSDVVRGIKVNLRIGGGPITHGSDERG